MSAGVFLPYQSRWCNDPASVKIIEKSRRIGITWATAGSSVLAAGRKRGADQWYVGYNQEMALEFIRDAAWWARKLGLAASEVSEVLLEDDENDVLAFQIRFASGKRITALSSRPSNLRGKQGNVILDEAAFHDDLEGLLKAAIALLMWGGTVAIISTHNGVDNAFCKLIEDSRGDRLPYSVHRVTLDDALADGLYRRICEVRDLDWSKAAEKAWRKELIAYYGDDAQEELFCVPAKSGGVYLSRTLIESRMIDAPVYRWNCPDDLALKPEKDRKRAAEIWIRSNLHEAVGLLDPKMPHWLGEDFGRVSDLTVLAPVTQGQDMKRAVPFLVELRNVPFEQQKQILIWLADRLPRFSGGALDAGGNGQYLAEVAVLRYGQQRIQAVSLSLPWYAEHLPPLKAALEDGALSLPKDLDVLQDLTALRVVDGVPRLPKSKTKNKKGESRHGDAAIAIALGYYASRQIRETFGYRPVKATEAKGKGRRVKSTQGFRSRGGLL